MRSEKNEFTDIIDYLIDAVQEWQDKTGQIIKTPGSVAYQGCTKEWVITVYEFPYVQEGHRVFGYDGSVIGPRMHARIPPALAEKGFKKAHAAQKQ